MHTMLVIGGRDLETGAGSVRLHGKGNVGAKPKGEATADILAAIRERPSAWQLLQIRCYLFEPASIIFVT